MKETNICPICKIQLSKSITVSGPEVTYTRNINLGISKINFCANCGLGVNLSFKPFDFSEINYSNIDIDLINNEDDNLILYHLYNYLRELLAQTNVTETPWLGSYKSN